MAHFGVIEPTVAAKTQVTERAQAFRVFHTLSQDHSTFTSSNNLICVKAKTTQVSNTAHLAALVGGAMRFGSIFNDEKAILARKLQERVHINRVTVHVNGHDCPGAR